VKDWRAAMKIQKLLRGKQARKQAEVKKKEVAEKAAKLFAKENTSASVLQRFLRAKLERTRKKEEEKEKGEARQLLTPADLESAFDPSSKGGTVSEGLQMDNADSGSDMSGFQGSRPMSPAGSDCSLKPPSSRHGSRRPSLSRRASALTDASPNGSKATPKRRNSVSKSKTKNFDSARTEEDENKVESLDSESLKKKKDKAGRSKLLPPSKKTITRRTSAQSLASETEDGGMGRRGSAVSLAAESLAADSEEGGMGRRGSAQSLAAESEGRKLRAKDGECHAACRGGAPAS